MTNYIKSNNLNNSNILFLIVAVIIFSLIMIRPVLAQGLVIPGPQSVNLTNGTLNKNVYVVKDESAYQGNKIVFGQPDVVSFSTTKTMTYSTDIVIGKISKSTQISPLDYGANIVWYDGGYGVQNLSNDKTYPGVTQLIKNIGINAIRYPGGIPSDTFNWQTAIGPQSSRQSNVVYQSQNTFFPSNFGPDEFGQLLGSTNTSGDITVNFGTGTAQEAANWVQYMTSSSKTNYWGELRAKNGHPQPYNIPYWEVGNETEAVSGENYWRSGSVVSIGSSGNRCPIDNINLCEYIYGGVTYFGDQTAIASNNLNHGDGTPNQKFYAKYPPVEANSQTVYVNGIAWHQIKQIKNASSTGHDYQLNNTTGEIVFGDGINGEVVPNNASVKISYRSGPHDGFLEYYQLMKAADPKAEICSSYDSPTFIQIMGIKPYDCLVVHLYAGEIPSTNSSPLLFHNSIIQQSNAFASLLSSDQAEIKQYAGSNASKIHLAVTEYGVNALTKPANQPDYHRSLDMALFVANTLKIIIDAHVPIAEKHYLISYQNEAAPGVQSYVNSPTFADNALIGGPGPNPILQPSAYVIEAYSKLLYSHLVSSSVQNNPEVMFSGGNYSSLSTIATTDNKGNEAIMVINLSPYQSIKSEIQPSINNYTVAKAWTLGANSFLSYNTQSDPSVVGLVMTNAKLIDGKLIGSFPPNSVTVIQMSK